MPSASGTGVGGAGSDRTPADATAESRAGSRSVLRALEVLELLADHDSPMSLARITKELDIPKTSCLGLLRALSAREFIRQDETGSYGLGVRSFEVGAAYLRTMTPTRAVAGELRALTGRLGTTSHFAILDGDEVVYLVKHDPPGSGIRLASELGARLSASTTAVGTVQLAFTSAAEALGAIRERGYAVDEGKTAAGIRCVAAPVFDTRGCCGAIGVSYLAQGGPPATEVAEPITAAARRVTAELGGRWPISERSIGERPAGEQPAREQPAGEQPAREQPAGEQPAREQPARERPIGPER
jgi:DNA-binding IclR family transcriptional regulator